MPWREVSTVSLRHEFVLLANAEGARVRGFKFSADKSGSCPRTAHRCCRLTVSAARTNLALLIRRAVRCSRMPQPSRYPVAALRHEERDASWRVRGGRVKRGPPRRHPQDQLAKTLMPLALSLSKGSSGVY
jgi:hypothetical protein